jgi:hypothetical protein
MWGDKTIYGITVTDELASGFAPMDITTTEET